MVLSQTTLGGKDDILREITIDPGGSTGWHWHDGNLFGVVRQGTLTISPTAVPTESMAPAMRLPKRAAPTTSILVAT